MKLNNTTPKVNNDIYDLDKFPKEFKKKFRDGFEPKFAIILLSSIFMHFALALFLSTHLTHKTKASSVEKVRKQFARLLLDRNPEYLETVKELASKPSDYASNFDLIESSPNELSNYEPSIEKLLDFSEALTSNRELPSAGAVKVGSEINAERRRTAREELYKEVERIGLLAVITSGSVVGTYAEIVDILEFADSTAGDLERMLEFLISLRVPRSDGVKLRVAGGLPVFVTNPKEFSKPLTVKRMRVSADNIHVNELVEKLRDVEEMPFKKTEKYEEVPSTYSLTSLRSTMSSRNARRMTRDPDEVRDVVVSHYSAIQDCYTNILKINPTLKGKVVIRFVVSPEGKVISASVVSSTINENEMLECILARVLRWNDFSLLNPSAGNMAFKQTYVFGL